MWNKGTWVRFGEGSDAFGFIQGWAVPSRYGSHKQSTRKAAYENEYGSAMVMVWNPETQRGIIRYVEITTLERIPEPKWNSAAQNYENVQAEYNGGTKRYVNDPHYTVVIDGSCENGRTLIDILQDFEEELTRLANEHGLRHI